MSTLKVTITNTILPIRVGLIIFTMCVFQQLGETIVFGLKVFVQSKTPPVVDGIKAVAHAVLRDTDGKYRDPSPEWDEAHIMFIHVPHMFSQQQINEIMISPEDARLGVVVLNVKDAGFCHRVFAMDPFAREMCARRVDQVPVVVVNKERGEGHVIHRDGSRSPYG